MNGPTRERGGASRPQGEAPSPSVDVLAAQVREAFDNWNADKFAAHMALDALVARVKNAEVKAVGLFDDLYEAEARVRDLVARVTEAEQLLRRVARSPDPKWINEQIDSYFAARLDGSSE